MKRYSIRTSQPLTNSARNCCGARVCLILAVIIVLPVVFMIFISSHLVSNNRSDEVSSLHLPMSSKDGRVESTSSLTLATVVSTPTEKKEVLTPNLHFIHLPKCGGTTMTTILREIQCRRDPMKNADCCLNPGFCDWHAHRRCASIKGCINHFPNRY